MMSKQLLIDVEVAIFDLDWGIYICYFKKSGKHKKIFLFKNQHSQCAQYLDFTETEKSYALTLRI